MATEQIPQTMFAWRKHRGNPEPVWEEVPVPEVTPTGVLCQMIASGGKRWNIEAQDQAQELTRRVTTTQSVGVIILN